MTTTKRAGSSRSKAGKGTALSMIRGSGESATTFYSCGAVEDARENRQPLRILRGGKERLLRSCRMVHRPDLTGTYSQIHERAGEGKYINQDAIVERGDRRVVVGAQNVNPFLTEERSYNTIVAAFHRLAGRNLASLEAVIKRNRQDGEHLDWQGKRTVDDAVFVSPWINKEDLWALACKVNDELVSSLRSMKSQRKGVKEHLGSKAKFFQNLDVLRRSRRTFQVATGETEVGGGSTPYAMPLEQCGFAIDLYYLTSGIDENGHEVGEYFYRMAYGRSIPWTLYKRHWVGLGQDAEFAYLNDSVRKQAMSASKRQTAA